MERIMNRETGKTVIVPMDHFLTNAPKEYLEHISKNPELLAFVDPDFEINP